MKPYSPVVALGLMLAAFHGFGATETFAQGLPDEGAVLPEQHDPKPEPSSALAKAAQAELVRYLEAVKAKKWAEAKKYIHPKTVQAIAERKKRLGREDHPMAPWTHEKTEYYLKAYRVTGVEEGPTGTFFVSTSEDNFQVQEKGIAEGDTATYLLGRKDGKWFVADKKRGESFSDQSVKLGYKGYFDASAAAPTEPKQ